MFWPPGSVGNNGLTISDAKFVEETGEPPRFETITVSGTVLEPWVAWDGIDKPWLSGDAMLRVILHGDQPETVFTFNDDSHGAILTLGTIGAGRQKWEVVSVFDWYVDDDAGRVSAFVWARLWKSIPEEVVYSVVGGSGDSNSTWITTNNYYSSEIPAGTSQWFYVPGNGPWGYTIDASGIQGTAEINVYGGTVGSLTLEQTVSSDGEEVQSFPSNDGDGKYIEVVGDATEDYTMSFSLIASENNFLTGSSSCGDAPGIYWAIPMEVVCSVSQTQYFRMSLGSAYGYTLDVFIEGGASIAAYGGDCSGSTLEASGTGTFTATVAPGSHDGPYLILVLAGDPVSPRRFLLTVNRIEP